jgi:hypothetical protein
MSGQAWRLKRWRAGRRVFEPVAQLSADVFGQAALWKCYENYSCWCPWLLG